jgi:hypothetical protein
MTIPDKEMAALHNLADKHAGKEVDWINIADARALTALGLARRTGGGWEITAQGLALVKGVVAGLTLISQNDRDPQDSVLQFPTDHV